MPAPCSYPIVVIDFEATALALDSYPIEVGIAILAEPCGEIETRSWLIKPDADWDISARWDPDAERVHGIRRWDLRQGKNPATVMGALNALIPGSEVWCDGGSYDEAWLMTLAHAAKTEPAFSLRDIGPVLRQDERALNRYQAISVQHPRPHRAGPDAAAICAALAAAME